MTEARTAIVAVERHLAATPDEVFDAWLDADGLGGWLFRTPAGELVRVEVDARVGGRFRIDERRDGKVVEHHGEYVELERPRRLAFDFWASFSAERTRVAIDIEAVDGGSLLRLIHDGVWPDWADKTQQGWTMILTGLARNIASP